MRGVARFVVVAALGACASLDNLSQGGADAGPDATPPAPPPVASPPPGDGGTDATDAEAGIAFCTQHPSATMCADFDGPAAFAGWSSTETRAAGTTAIVTDDFLSPPSAMRSTAPAADGGAIARLVYDLPKTATRTRVSFGVSYDPATLAPGERASIGEIVCDQNASAFFGAFLFWQRTAGGQPELDLITDSNVTSLIATTTKSWTRYEIDITWGATSSAKVSVDGVEAVTKQLAQDCRTKSGAFRFVMGVAATGPMAANATYDDVLVDVDPP